MAKTNTVKPTSSDEDGSHMNKKGYHIMAEMPIWKAMLRMALPAMVMMLIVGGYMFADNILAIQLAPDSYGGSKDVVRMGVSAFGPINSLIVAFSLLLGLGISTRVSINLGAKKVDRAKNSFKTGSMIGMGVAIVLIPVLIFASTPWMKTQYAPAVAGQFSSMGFDYGWIIIMMIPFTFFNQIVGGMFRTEGRNKDMMLPMVASIGVNLLFDWIFMGPAGMGIEGGAWATFISTVMVSVIYVIIMLKKKNSIVRLQNMFGFHFKAVSIIGILLVGFSPFLRNFAQSITQTVEMNVIKDVSYHIYTQSGHVGETLRGVTLADLTAGPSGGTKDAFQMLFGDQTFVTALHKNDAVGMMTQINNLGYSPDSKGGLFISNTLRATISDHSIYTMLGFKANNLADLKAGKATTISGIDPNNFKALQGVVIEATASTEMTLILTGVFPIFALFFPVMFSFAQAARPLASFNYGAKKLHRVRQVYWYTMLYATIAAIIMYFLATFALNYPLLSALGVSDSIMGSGEATSMAYKATMVLRIMMISMPMFGAAIAAMQLTGSTDRIVLSTVISAMRGIIFFFPAVYIFKAIALANPGQEYLFWWFYPALAACAVIFSTIIAIYVLKHLDKKHETLDDKLKHIYAFFENKQWRKNKSTK